MGCRKLDCETFSAMFGFAQNPVGSLSSLVRNVQNNGTSQTVGRRYPYRNFELKCWQAQALYDFNLERVFCDWIHSNYPNKPLPGKSGASKKKLRLSTPMRYVL
jgi:hypothetical protein